MKEVSKEQIEEWKKQHGKVFFLKTNTAKGFIKKPGIFELDKAIFESDGGKKPMAFASDIIKTCWLGGDESIYENEDNLMGCVKYIQKIIVTVEAEVGEC